MSSSFGGWPPGIGQNVSAAVLFSDQGPEPHPGLIPIAQTNIVSLSRLGDDQWEVVLTPPPTNTVWLSVATLSNSVAFHVEKVDEFTFDLTATNAAAPVTVSWLFVAANAV